MTQAEFADKMETHQTFIHGKSGELVSKESHRTFLYTHNYFIIPNSQISFLNFKPMQFF